MVVVGLGIIVCLGLLRVTGVERAGNTVVEQSVQAVLTPLQMGISGVTRHIGAIGQAVVNYQQVKEDSEALRRENGELRRENALLRQYQVENIRLREFLAFKQEKEANYELLAVRVIARDPGTWFHTLTLDHGSNDGILKDMVVINNDGLIGHVVSVSPRSCQVLLIIDREGPVPGISQISREPGIVEAKADGSGLLQMVHLRRDAVVKEGQMILTSGLGSLYPRGLRIGYVVGIEPEPNGLTKRATIRPAVDFQRLEEVFLVKKVYKQEDIE